ncbi:MAG: protease modulator HflK [Clostridia bacterium]|nr:protease modulator HflK [Clostridia bacterium]
MRKEKKKGVFADILTSVTKWFLIVVAVVIVCLCLSGIRIVKSGEVAVVLRFGRLVGETYEEQIHEPGLLLAFPYIIDEVVTVPTESVLETLVTTHYTSGRMTTLRNNGYVITGDQNIVIISAAVKYVISDPVEYALYVNQIDSMINGFVSNSMIEEAAYREADNLLTTEKDVFGDKIVEKSQAKLDMVGAGVMIKSIELTTVSMPEEVREIYNQVNAANVQASTALEQARLYHENLIPSAQAQSNTLITDANARYSSNVAAATQDLAEFWGLIDEYELNPKVVTTRVYSAKMSEAIAKIGKVRVVQDGETKIFID